MKSQFGSVTVNSFDTVGPSVGLEVTQRAALAVGLASLGILAYISFAFRNTPNAFRYGVAAIIAMLHDVAVVIGMAALFLLFFTEFRKEIKTIIRPMLSRNKP